MNGLYEQSNQFGATQKDFLAIERGLAMSQAKITGLQTKYNDEGKKINRNLQQIQQTTIRLKQEYAQEQVKVNQTGRPSSRLQTLAHKIHTNMVKYNELRKGTERYFKLKYELQNEQRHYNNLLNKYKMMKTQYK